MQNRTHLALIAGLGVVLALDGSAAPVSATNFMDAFAWESDDPGHGGFSGVEFSNDGLSFTTISDRAGWTRGTITRDAQGRITAIQADPVLPLLDTNGKQLYYPRADSEGLAIGPGGGFFISFEGIAVARIMAFSDLAKPGRDMPRPPEFAAMRDNASLEALAVDQDGTLFTLPETPRGDVPLPIFRYKAGVWDQPATVSRDKDFDAVGADFGPDGRFYLLERGFHGLFGFSSRVRSFAVTDGAFSQERVELQTAPGTHDNLEGITVWQAQNGDIRMTMMSDDNFFWAQRTELVEYRTAPR